MKNYVFILLFLLCAACGTLQVPESFTYRDIQTAHFKLASWQKITNPTGVYKIYIEGDGHAFNRRGMPTSNPTPHNDFWRRAAFDDPSDNVIYLARPCQYVTDKICTETDWTIRRFSKEGVDSTAEAIYNIAGENPVILIGFSGGAQVAGLTAVTHPKLNVTKIITVAGNIDHKAWTTRKNLQALYGSLDLNDYRKLFLKFPQIHYVGDRDKVIPYALTQNFIAGEAPMVIVPKATHQTGWNDILQAIWKE